MPDDNSNNWLIKLVWFQWQVDVCRAQVLFNDFKIFLGDRQIRDVIHNSM